ncbi:molybdopterin-guanine dinucleotide biosynthesis protein B [Neisseriaceae bacterium TC5R-5]|nr:molybdopterin-guanine dinucleotide biosynthesis protein B [Neisseriaceae bacterium TC5R-5]
MYVLGLAGYSGSGKTTLLEKLIPLLRAQGLRVAVIKHTHHDVDWDQPGKDSWRHRQAGASQVILAAGKRRMLVEEQEASNELPLAAQLAWLGPCDLVLVEGYKHEAIPKLEVVNSQLNAPALYPEDARVLALVADVLLPCPLPCFQRDAPDRIVHFILSQLDSSYAEL